MSNRKARRQAAAAAAPPPTSASDIPLSQPDRSTAPKGTKTLIDLAAERQASLTGGTPFSATDADDAAHEIHWKDLPGVGLPKGAGANGGRKSGATSKGRPGESDDDDKPIGPLGLSVVYAISLTMLHFTLDVLAHNQYRQNIAWQLILKNTA